MRDSFKIDCGIRNEKREITGYGCFADNYDSNKAGRHENTYWGGMVKLSQKILAGCGSEKPYVGPSVIPYGNSQESTYKL